MGNPQGIGHNLKMIGEFVYNEKTREHVAGGKTVPSVTEVLAKFFPPSQFYTKSGKEKGANLHLCCQFLAENDLDWDSVHPEILPQVRAYQRFLAETLFRPTILEQAFHDNSLWVCGKPDQIGVLGGRLSVIDIKRGSKLQTHKLQTAAYKMILTHNDIPVLDRYALYLSDDKYRLEKHLEQADENSFRTLLAALHTIKNYGG